MIRRLLEHLTFWLNWVAKGSLLAITLIVMIMIFLRKLNIATLGFYEIILIFAFLLYITSWACTSEKHGHIRIAIVADRLRPLPRSLNQSFMNLLSLGACALIVWASIVYGHKLQTDGALVSIYVRLPVFLLLYLMALSFVLSGIVYVLDFIGSLFSLIKKQ